MVGSCFRLWVIQLMNVSYFFHKICRFVRSVTVLFEHMPTLTARIGDRRHKNETLLLRMRSDD
jgi:hypothetical protein